MKKTLLSLVLLAGVFIVSNGQKTLKEWSELEDKKFTKKWNYVNTLNHLKTSVKKGWVTKEEIPEVSEIGILGLTLFQPTFTDVKGFQTLNIYTGYLTDAGITHVIDEMGKHIIPGFGEGCRSGGIEPLASDKYLDSDEKQKIFDAYEWEPSKLMGATAAIASFVRSPQTKYDPKASWGKMVMMADSDVKTWRDIGKLAGQLDLDMMAVIEQTIFFNGKSKTGYLGPIKIVLIGPNPTPETDNVKYAPAGPLKGYLEGFVYSSVIVTPPNEYEVNRIEKIKIDGNKTDKMFFPDLSPLNKIYSRITAHVIDNMKSEIAALKE